MFGVPAGSEGVEVINYGAGQGGVEVINHPGSGGVEVINYTEVAIGRFRTVWGVVGARPRLARASAGHPATPRPPPPQQPRPHAENPFFFLFRRPARGFSSQQPPPPPAPNMTYTYTGGWQPHGYLPCAREGK